MKKARDKSRAYNIMLICLFILYQQSICQSYFQATLTVHNPFPKLGCGIRLF
jgi:hypothetical protein